MQVLPSQGQLSLTVFLSEKESAREATFCSVLVQDLLSCGLTDVSPTRQGVDHRQVQKELGEVVVQLQEPVILTSTTIQVTWTVSTLGVPDPSPK